jgi:hypothetical protein
LNPGSPAPQASVLIRTRGSGARIPLSTPNSEAFTRLRAHADNVVHRGLIISSLLKLKNRGLSDNTLHTTSQKLRQLARNATPLDPEDVKTYIANSNVSNATKQKLANTYDYFCKTNSIEWERPRFKWERKIPLIPTTRQPLRIPCARSNALLQRKLFGRE